MMKVVKLFILLIALSVIFFIKNGDTATINANSCSQTDVQTAINSANAGDTVLVPAGTGTWKSRLSVSKGITLKGAGIDKTIIINNVPTSAGAFDQTAIYINVAGATPWHISGFTFTDTGTYYDYLGFMRIHGTCTGWTLKDCKFKETNGRGVTVSGITYGLIYNCQFEKLDGQSILVKPTSGGGTLWTTATTFGGEDAVYIEDCTFTNLGTDPHLSLDVEEGAKVVFRHNVLTNSTGLCVHGYEYGNSGLRLEAYDNQFTATTSLDGYGIFDIRGGTGVFFNNTITGTYWKVLGMKDYCACKEDVVPTCNHTKCTTYPCTQQVGRTYNQKAAPVYQWNNRYNGELVTGYVHNFGACSDPSVYDIIQLNRDYYDNVQMPGYTPYQYPHPLRVPGAPPKAPSLFIVPTP